MREGISWKILEVSGTEKLYQALRFSGSGLNPTDDDVAWNGHRKPVKANRPNELKS